MQTMQRTRSLDRSREMKTLTLSQGLVARVDKDVYSWAASYKWSAVKYGNRAYAVRSIGTRPNRYRVYLHQCIIGRPLNGFVIDHIDGDGLNNLRENLRIVSVSDNSRNSYKHRAGQLFGADRRPGGRWRAHTRIDGKLVHLGTFDTQEEASKVARDFGIKC